MRNGMNEMQRAQRYGFWLGIGCLVVATGCSRQASDGPEGAQRARPVELVSIESMTFTRAVPVQGTWEARDFAMVPARIGGVLDAILVEDGAAVTNGQALAQMDAEQWEYTVAARRQDVNVARHALAVAKAQAERAAAERERAENEHRRFQALRADHTVSEQAAEQVATQWKAAVAAEKVARARIDLATAQLQQTESGLAITERDLRDTVVRAPLSGVISQRLHERGEVVAANASLFRIDNLDAIEFRAFLAERHYPLVEAGRTQVQLRTAERAIGEYQVSYQSPTVHETFRTFEIKCLLESPPDWLVPGMMASARVVLDQREGRGVPADSLVRRSDKAYVFVVVDGRAYAHPVQVGYETDGLVEILEGLPDDASHVVGAGQFALDDGARVTLRREEN